MLELNCKTYGDPSHPAIVLLHGLFGSATNWGSIARRLAGDYHVIVPDLRNHGQSPHASTHTYPAMAGDLLALLDRLDRRNATLVGHSMGGKVAMHVALTTPQRVAGLAVVDMAPVRYGHDFRGVLAGFAAVDTATIGARADAEAQMRPLVPGSGVRAFLLQNLVRQDGAWAWRLNLAALEAAQEQITGFPEHPADAGYAGPAVFIHGELSDYVKPSHQVAIERLFPKAALCRVEAAGHWVYADRPDGFMACLEGFLARLPAADGGG